MGFKDIFKKDKAPKNDGDNIESANIASGELTYYLQFSNIEGQPIFELKDALTVGSETGDIVFDDPSLSPKHCSVYLNQGVVSVIDHSSEEGTFISDHQLTPGKMMIVSDGDYIRAGELEIDIVTHAPKVSEDVKIAPKNVNPDHTAEIDSASLSDDTSEILSANFEDKIDNDASELAIEVDDESDATQDIDPRLVAQAMERKSEEVIDEEQSHEDFQERPSFFARIFKRKKNKEDESSESQDEELADVPVRPAPVSKFSSKLNKGAGKVKVSSGDTIAGPLTRVVALIIDFVLVAAIAIIISPFRELGDYTILINDFVIQSYNSFFKGVVDEFWPVVLPYLEMVSFLKEYLLKFIDHIEYLYLFLAFRAVCTFLFGCSLGLKLCGVSAGNGFVRNRVGGIFREVLGILFLPLFWLVELPVLFGKRSFKELISLTRLELPSGWRFWPGLIIFLPLSVGALIVSPLFIGFEYSRPMAVKRTPQIKSEAQNYFRSTYLSLKISQSTLGTQLIPRYETRAQGQSRVLNPYVSFYFDDKQEYELRFSRKFSMASFLTQVSRADLMFSQYYPSLSQFTKELGILHKPLEGKSLSVFQDEFVSYLERAFSLDIENVHEHVMAYGPFLYGYVNARELIKEISQLELITSFEIWRVNNLSFIALQGQGGTDSRSITLIPISEVSSHVYKISFPATTPIKNAIDNIKQRVMKSIAYDKSPMEFNYPFNPLSLLDFIPKIGEVAEDQIGNYYLAYKEYVFNYIKNSIQSSEKQKLVSLLNEHIMAIEARVSTAPSEYSTQLLKQLNEMKYALENDDLKFFGVVNPQASL